MMRFVAVSTWFRTELPFPSSNKYLATTPASFTEFERAPFVQFTYSVVPPIPKSLPGVSTEASERIWMNLPPARVWVYRKG